MNISITAGIIVHTVSSPCPSRKNRLVLEENSKEAKP